MIGFRVYHFLFFSFLFCGKIVSAQEEASEFKAHHSISLIISHTQISQGIQSDGDRKWLSLPSWGLNYNYVFHRNWALGLHTDIIVEDFAVEEHLKSSGGQTLERAYPIALALMTTYKVGKHLSFVSGAGGEFANSGSLFLVRIGVEYSWHIGKDWELIALATNDYRFNAFNSWAIGLGVTRIL